MKALNIHLLKSKLKSTVTYNPGALNTFLNPYSYLILRKSPELIQKMDSIFIDGISFVIILKLFGIKNCTRQSFDMTTVAKLTFEFAQNNNKTIYFVGTKPDIIEKSVAQIQKFYPKLQISGFHHGYFKNDFEISQLQLKILKSQSDILIVGTGTPRQEAFLVSLKEKGWNGVGFTCGGFLHQIVENLHYYPPIMDKLHIRWLYRIFDEPKLLQRYLIDYSFFLVVFIFDVLATKFKSKLNSDCI